MRKNRHPHPLVYMRALKSEDLMAIMDFLYFGEANIFQENLDSFLALAEELKLKGLDTNADDDVKIPAVYEEVPTKKEKSQQRRGTAFDNQTFESSDTQVATFIKDTASSADLEDLDGQIRSMITKSDVSTGKGKMATCNICGKEGLYMSMPRHVEAHHITGVSHSANICGAVSRSTHGLRQHKKTYHKDNVFVAGPEKP